MTTLTKANARVVVIEEQRHLGGDPDTGRMSWRSFLVTEGRESGCSHALGHRSKAAAETCGKRRYRALPDVDPDEASAGGLPR